MQDEDTTVNMSASTSTPQPIGQEYLVSVHGSAWRSVAYELLVEYQKYFQMRTNRRRDDRIQDDMLGIHILTFIDLDLENALLRGSTKERIMAAEELLRRATESREKRRMMKLKHQTKEMLQWLRQISTDL